ncbi:MAG: acyl--CoA ligase [Alphaproteobacteria bacterium]|nr:acyl--CoA ligase [Alphaproteobacteria bacterium]
MNERQQELVPLDALLRRRADAEPERPLIATAEAPSLVTARALCDLAGAAAATLAQRGVGPGDRIGLWGQNSVAWAVWLCAAAWRGASIVALHPALGRDDLSACLRTARVDWLIADEVARGRDLAGMAQAVIEARRGDDHHCPRGLTVIPGGDGVLDLSSVLDRGAAVPTPSGTPEAPLNIQFTAGSTGRPKAVVLSQRALLTNAMLTAQAAAIDGDDRVVSPLPLYHAAGLSSGLLLSLATGALWCTSHRFEPATSLALIDAHHATVFQGVPTMFQALTDLGRKRGGDYPSMRLGFIGGAPCPAELCADAIEVFGLSRMAIVYGQTEFGPTIAMTRGDEPDNLALTTVGRPLPGVELRITDPQTDAQVPLGADGEIQVRGATMMDGYFGDPDATAAVVTRDGWLKTGDLGRIDHGSLRLRGRLKELIIRGGENVSPIEVEAALQGLSGVSDVVVVPAPSAYWGEEICAVIEANDPAGLDVNALSRGCAERLPRFMRPDRYIIREDLPHLPSGKVDRAAVRRAVGTGEWK